MPYLKVEDKEYLSKIVKEANSIEWEDPGQLNYVMTELCKAFMKSLGGRYYVHDEIIGALECCKLEFYRRKTAVYEDQKIEENGDVYGDSGLDETNKNY